MLVILALPVGRRAIVSVDVADDSAFKLAPPSFNAGTGLSPHGAPGDALARALDDGATIDHEGNERPIRAG